MDDFSRTLPLMFRSRLICWRQECPRHHLYFFHFRINLQGFKARYITVAHFGVDCASLIIISLRCCCLWLLLFVDTEFWQSSIIVKSLKKQTAMTELSNILTNTSSAEEDNGGECSSLLAEYEDRFQHIDSTLEDLRSSFVEVSREDCFAMDDDDDNDASILEEEDDDKIGASASMSTLKATLAEQSAAEMEKIVQTLKDQQKEGSEEATTASSEGEAAKGEEPQNASGRPSPSSHPKGWMTAFLLIPVIFAILWAWNLQSTSRAGAGADIVLQQQPSIQYRSRKVSRTRCRYVNGQQYCESDEQAQSISSQGDQHYKRQQCQYINGESYCESESESESFQNPQQNGNRIAG